MTGTQTEVVTKAAVNFVFIGDLTKDSRLEDINLKRQAIQYDIGYVTMVLYLFASANNMKGVVRGNYDSEHIIRFLGLNSEDYYIGLTFSLGY